MREPRGIAEEHADMVPAEVGRRTGVRDVREGGDGDAVLGVVPALVAAPESVEEVARLLKWANEAGVSVAPCGTRTKVDRGNPPRSCGVLLDLRRLASVIEHAAGDLTVTVQAGARLDELQSHLGEAGQWLAIDPPVPGTVGGLIATADSGPSRLRYGGVRDLILGVTFVRADGVVAKGGGKVVKNVAGYDMPKLMTGSLGTLGVIVEATFRLHPVPQDFASVVREATVREAGGISHGLMRSPVVPSAIDFVQAAGTSVGELAVRFTGTPRSVEAQARAAVAILGEGARIETGEADRELWSRAAGITEMAQDDVLARLVSAPSDMPGLVKRASEMASRADVPLSIRAHLGHGHALLRWHTPAAEAAVGLVGGLRREAEARGSNLVVWRAPLEVRQTIDTWGDVGEGLALMRRVKEQFDPKGILNPGRYVGGI